MCHVARHVTFFSFFFGQSGEAYRWRVCYQRGLPRLVFIEECKTQQVSKTPFKTRIINKQTIPGYENILRTAPWGNVIKDDPKASFDCFFSR